LEQRRILKNEKQQINYCENMRLTKNPFLLFLPFLLLYTILVLILYNKILWGDEIRHFAFAENLFHGFYSPPAPNISLDMGPGYPLFILPFIALHIPLICVNLMNAVFNYLTIVFLFKALQQIIPFKPALIFSLFFACYSNSLEFIALIYSESLTLFLVSLMVFFLIKAFNPDNIIKAKKYIILCGFVIGYLALTKIIFGYVLLLMLAGSGLLWIVNRKSINYRKIVFILLVGLATTLPYLIYTYHLTGRLFYWGTSGGNNLYWMSTPYKGEYGNWIPDPKFDSTLVSTGNNFQLIPERGGEINLKNRINNTPGSEDSLDQHHKKDYEEIYKYTGIERDDVYRKLVMNNIKSHPGKYIENCISNIGRMLFNYPYSYTFQKPGTLLRLPLNGIIIVFTLFCLVPTLVNWGKLIVPIRFMLFFILLYFGGSILGSAETRMFTVIVPILLFWIAYISTKSIKLKLKFNENSNESH
jgi:4-amino-4-deoxy-L-arabinose transferase-like glycosyltransferase